MNRHNIAKQVRGVVFQSTSERELVQVQRWVTELWLGVHIQEGGNKGEGGKEQDSVVTEIRNDTFPPLTHLVPGYHHHPPGQRKIGFKGDPILLLFFFFNIYLLIWLCWVLVVAHKIFYCGMWLSWPMQCGIFSSLARDQTHVPCIAGQILKYWNTREAPKEILL